MEPRTAFGPIVLVLPLLAGCSLFNPRPPEYPSIEYVRERLDMAASQAAPMPEYVPLQERLLFYFPNRLLDALDIVKATIGVGPGVGLEVYLSENIWVSYLNYRSWRLGLDGRSGGVYEEGHYREWHLSDAYGERSAAGRAPLWATPNLRPFEAPLRPGVPAVPQVRKNTWDIGAQVHFLLGAEGLVRPYEIVDFVVGLWTDDLAQDDFGLRWYPLHEYAVQAEILEIFLNAVDQVNVADLKATLSTDLQKHALVSSGNQLVRLDEQGPSVAPAKLPLKEDKTLIYVGDVKIDPAVYRTADTGQLEYAYACTGVRLRWGVPAELRYELTFYNRFLRQSDVYDVWLRVEHGHWVITRIESRDRADD